ncbi:hypothetical protein [Nocardia mangyaensis]|uniref:hypothetical protein n=1 Tax=Nocardia mangyaensis TaxID=2213200 RepID=UPI002674AC15|nr:hypothetical protein [Nocardia mangyaensis]MDO3645680.1 hypothetical protein [Nocardia mangyaensis]
MNEALLADVARMNAYVHELSSVMQRAQQSGPARSVGRDDTGTVEVTLDHEGVLVDIVVSEQWTQKLDVSGIGAAVVAAFRGADSQRLAATMTALADPRVLESLRRVNLNSVMPSSVEPPPLPPTSRISAELLGEDAVRELETAIPLDMPVSTGQAAVGAEVQAQVRLDARGIVDCSVRVAWGQPVSGGTIARAIQEAYGDARRAHPSGTDPNVPTLGNLIDATLTELCSMQNEILRSVR